MTTTAPRRLLLALTLFVPLFAVSLPAHAQPKPPEDAKPAAKPDDAVIREQTIYIPFTKLRETFEKEGRGVFLPYDKFQELWNAARGKEGAPPVVKPPTGALLSEIESVAVAEKDVVRVTAKVSIEVLSKGWHTVPLRLGDTAIVSAKIGNESARVVFDSDGYKLLVNHPDEKPGTVTLTLEYAKAFAKNPGQNSVAFEAPQAPVNRWQIRIPQAGAKINVQPMIAASEQPATKPAAGQKPAEETVVLAFVGAAPLVRIDWTAKAEGATGLAALANVQSQQEVEIDEGLLRTRTLLAFDISRAELSQLVVEVPANQKVVNVFDPNVRQWDVKVQGESQQITVQLFQPTRGAQNLIVELERLIDDAAQKEVKVPVVKALGVGRQQGVVVVRLATSLRGEVLRRVGLTQLDAAELPQSLAKSPWDFRFRYATLPFDLALTTEKLQPKIRVEELVEVYLEPEQVTLDLLALYTIERAGVYQFELTVPAGFDVRQVRGQVCGAAGAAAAVVDSHRVEGDDKTKLIVNLSQKAFGVVGLLVELHKRLDDPNLLTPTGKASDLSLPIPRVSAASVERSNGRLVVFAPESLRVNPTQQDGLRTVSFAEAYQGTESTRAGRFPTTREVFAFLYSQQPVTFAVSAERRKPFVTVRQGLVARFESGVIKFEATFFYDIRYSGVKTLRIDLPAELAKEIRNETPAVREKTIEPPPEKLAEGYVAWSFAGETEFLGQPTIKLTWEKKIDELEVGKSLEKLAIPRLRPADVDRASGQVIVTKAESLDVQPAGEPRGLRQIDPYRDLMPGLTVTDAARAYEFQDDWELKITATRYKLEEVKRTSIERAVARMIVTRSHEIVVQGLYRVRSVHQRLAIKLPANFKLDTQPLKVNGRPVALERGDKDEFYVPLVGHNANDPFVLELRYTVPGDQRQLDLPEFVDDPAVQQVYICAYLPNELALLGSHGPWTDEFTWNWSSLFTVTPQPRQNDQQLINELTQGIAMADNPATSLPTDGVMYLYSTLRPAAAPDGSLRLTAFSKNWLRGLIFIVVAVIGIGLTGRMISSRFLALALLVILLVLAGVFLPTFSRQVIDGVLFAALSLVLVVWMVEFVMKAAAKRPASPFAATAASGAAVAPPTPETPPTPPVEPSSGGTRTPPPASDNAGGSNTSNGGPSNA